MVIGFAFLYMITASSSTRSGTSPGVPLREPSVHTKATTMTNSVGMEFVLIPPGDFEMGTPDTEAYRSANEGPVHHVTISHAFFIGKFEVTQSQYLKVMGMNPSLFSTHGELRRMVDGINTSNFPVENVSWDDAARFCVLLSAFPAERKRGRQYRLPTEAEWEYACRGGGSQPFGAAGTLTSEDANFNGEKPYGIVRTGRCMERPCAVGMFRPNGFGLYDMYGNVAEWCADFYEEQYYRRSVARDPEGPSKEVAEESSGWFQAGRVNRGGAWLSPGYRCRAGARGGASEHDAIGALGFRVVSVLESGKRRAP
jgi:formylglycine-generating enzyme required for sulfatase activity